MDKNKMRGLTSELLSLMYRMRLLTKKTHHIPELPHAEFCMIMAIAKRTEHEEDKLEPGITVSELVEELGTTLPAGSKLLRNIEQKGLIERISNDRDRRVTYLRLSKKGLDNLKKQIQARDQMMEHIVCKMGEENMNVLLVQLQNLYSILKEEMEERQKND
ncbi:MAG: MarR family winged helix-turn-helix transcriptional regulator [Velocimicrobium sp.]